MSYREQEAHGPHRLLEQQFMYLSISKILDITCYNYYKTPIIFPRFYNTLNNT